MNCKVCGTPLHGGEQSCPACGTEVPGEEKRRGFSISPAIVIMLACLLLLAVMTSRAPKRVAGAGMTLQVVTSGAKDPVSPDSFRSTDDTAASSDRSLPLPGDTPVWVSASGTKYHSRNDCGAMDPDKARQMTLEDAQREGYTACGRCY